MALTKKQVNCIKTLEKLEKERVLFEGKITDLKRIVYTCSLEHGSAIEVIINDSKFSISDYYKEQRSLIKKIVELRIDSLSEGLKEIESKIEKLLK